MPTPTATPFRETWESRFREPPGTVNVGNAPTFRFTTFGRDDGPAVSPYPAYRYLPAFRDIQNTNTTPYAPGGADVTPGSWIGGDAGEQDLLGSDEFNMAIGEAATREGTNSGQEQVLLDSILARHGLSNNAGNAGNSSPNFTGPTSNASGTAPPGFPNMNSSSQSRAASHGLGAGWNNIAGFGGGGHFGFAPGGGGRISSFYAQHVLNKADGGRIPGKGRGDKVPALLEPEEVVLNRGAVAQQDAIQGGPGWENELNASGLGMADDDLGEFASLPEMKPIQVEPTETDRTLAQAKNALLRGAPRDKVFGILSAKGIDTSGL